MGDHKQKVKKEIIFFALGCFWGIESKLSKVDGIVNTEVGYMGGITRNPTYEKVLKGDTGHAETLKIVYDPDLITCSKLLLLFLQIHRKRGGYKDKKGQYRSAIFYTTDKQKKIIDKRISDKRIEISKAVIFYVAENYHQRYKDKKTKVKTENMQTFKRICLNNKDKAEKRKGKYYTLKYRTGQKIGIYKCALCKNNLYSSEHVFDSESGWPAFFDTIDGYQNSRVVFHDNATKELKCMKCGLHLGHRLHSKKTSTGLRDCLNSVCLYFVEKQKGGKSGKHKTKKKFLYNPNDPKKSFDVYIDKNPKDTIPIKYKTLEDVENTIQKLEKLYKQGKYSHKRIWQVGMIMKVRLEVLKDKKKDQYRLSKKYFEFLGKRTKIKGNKNRKQFKFMGYKEERRN